MSDDNERIELYPPWKEALEAFAHAGFGYGDLVSRAWFCEAIGMESLDRNARLTLAEHERRELYILQQFSNFREAVLEKMQMLLISDRAGAYLIIMPSKQAPHAYKAMLTNIDREIRKGMSRIKHVNMERLSTEDRTALMDIYAKAAGLEQRLMTRKRLPMDELDDDQAD